MAAMPIYGKKQNKKKTLKNLLWNRKAMTLKLGLRHQVLDEYYLVCSTDAPGLTLPYFTARSNLSLMLLYGKQLKNGFFRNYCSP